MDERFLNSTYPNFSVSMVNSTSTTVLSMADSTTGGSTAISDSVASNVTIEELNAFETGKYLSVLIVCVLIMVIGIIGNILVLIIYKYKFKRSSARTYILALAMADISVCVVGIPYHVMDLTMLLVYRFSYACKIQSFLIGACTNSSIYILLVIGLDRYLKVCRPLKKQIIDFGDRRACLVAVGVAVCMSIPNAILYGHSTVLTQKEGLHGVECFIDDYFVESSFAVGFMGINILLFILFLVFLVIIYGFICRKIYQQDHMEGEMNLNKSKKGFCSCVKQDEEDESDEELEEVDKDQAVVGVCLKDEDKNSDETSNLTGDGLQASNQNEKDTGANRDKVVAKKSVAKGRPRQKSTQPQSSGMVRHVQNKEKHTRKITLMMLTITVVFIISYLPFITISILTAMSDDFWENMAHFESVICDFILRMYLINNAANPIIYSFWDVRFRRECLALLKRFLRCGRPKEKPKNAPLSMSTIGSNETDATNI